MSSSFDFSRALQRSEARRVQFLIAVVAALGIFAVVRHLFGDSELETATFASRISVISLTAFYGVAVMLLVRRADRRDRILPSSFWFATTVLESFIPTFAIYTLTIHSGLEPVEAVRAPGLVIYFILSTLSVLRLRPILSLLGGLLGGVQHAFLVVLALRDVQQVNSIAALLYSFTALIVVAGVCAALVSREIRAHVLAGLREAGIRTELAAVRQNLQVARDIQQRLLPREPLVAGDFEVAGWNRPAEETGGDYCDWIRLPDGRVSLAIADVSGHGVGPALLMAVCRAYARASVPGTNGLSHAVSRLNQLLFSDIDDGRFVTFATAILDPVRGDLEILSAGHGPLLLYRHATGAIEVSGGDGPPLGVIPDTDFPTARRFRLEPGDALLMITDGFVEAKALQGEMFGATRLGSVLSSCAGRPAAELFDVLDQTVRTFTGAAPQLDDMTAVIVRRHTQS